MPKSIDANLRNLIIRLFVFIIVIGASSCADTKKLTYFNDIQDASIKEKVSIPEPIIQQNDLLSITVNSLNPEASAVFNAPNESTPNINNATANTNTLTVGYLVNANGDIQFPILGAIHAEGMTKAQLSGHLTKLLVDKKLLVDPIVTIRHLNFRVSVLGEVNKPGVYTVQNEKLSLLEALGLAGDLTIYGKRENVLVIRENLSGEKITKRLNLNSREVLTSPYYYLKSNDVIYVEPSKDRVAKERNAYILPILISFTTLFIVAVDRFGN